VSLSARLVDVYFEHRIVATCPVAGPAAERGPGEQPVTLALAKQMLKDDGVMTDEQLARAAFKIRHLD
jgi:hypothetical protein